VRIMNTFTFRRCRGCGAVLASTSRPDRAYCTTACRMAAYRRRQVADRLPPAELARLANELPPAIAESELLTGLAAAARADWRAAAWLLERRWPERWAPAERTEEISSNDEFDWAPDAAE
jgi:hypothetical protein